VQRLTALAILLILCSCATVRDPADGLTRMEEWQSQLPETRELASEYEREALTDGLVTAEEHEAGFSAMVRCIGEGGGRVGAPSRDQRGEIADWSAIGDQKVIADCQRRFFDFIQVGFNIALNPDLTPGALMRRMVDCLENAGITYLPADAEEGDLADLMRQVTRLDGDSSGPTAFSRCYEEHG